MATNDLELKKQFLHFLNQPDSCEQFYLYMKSEDLAYVLEFYLACDGLKNLLDNPSKQGAIIELIYKHYLSSGKDLSSKTKFHLSEEILQSIQQRLTKKEFHLKFYEQAQDYVLKQMLNTSYPKYLQQRSKKKDSIEQIKTKLNSSLPMNSECHQQRQTNALENSTLISDYDAGLQISKLPRTAKLTKQQKDQYSLAQRDPAAFFEEVKKRLLVLQSETSTAAKLRGLSQSLNIQNKFWSNDQRTVDEDSSAVLDSQIAKTIDDADNSLSESTLPRTPHRYRSNPISSRLNYFVTQSFTRSDSGVGTDSSEKSSDIFRFPSISQTSSPRRHRTTPMIDVIWYPSLDSCNALLSTIPRLHDRLTFKEFRYLFKKTSTYRYFFKTFCTPDINKEQYVFRELTHDDELVPLYDGKIFVQLDRISV